jgi:putative serine protease PepD
MTRPARASLIAASAIGLAAAGAGAGAGLYAALGPSSTTTTVQVDRNSEPVSATSTTSGELSVNDVYERTYRGVVDLTVSSDGSSDSSPFGGSSQAEGSGWVYDKQGHVVTNQHVVDSAGDITVEFWNGKKYSARLVGVDRSTDLAVIKVSAPASVLHPLEIGDSDEVEVGDGVIAIGSPFGLQGTVTSGIVSALHRQMQAPNRFAINDSIQTDAPINHGNSGGPLINASAQVIGVNTQIQSDSGGSDGVGFAVPSNTIRAVASQLVAGKEIQHAYLGVQVADAAGQAGATLATVYDGTPAARAGLQQGDVVTKLDDVTITESDDLSNVIDAKKPGDKLAVTYERDGKTRHATVTLGTRPSFAS